MVPASALSFTEDFEGFDLGGFDPEVKPSQSWYSYGETGDIGFVSDDAPVIGGLQSMKFQGSGTGTFSLAAGAQLTDLDFTVRGITISDDGVGSRQVIRVQSSAPARTAVEFFLFCDDPTKPTGCDLNVRFENANTFGETLVDASAGDSEFVIELNPDWGNGEYQLTVDAVDDGVFPFLELPQNIGKLQVGKPSGSKLANVVLDDWFIDGASDVEVTDGSDIANGLKSWASSVHFTSDGSLFVLGLVFLAVIVLAVGIPLVVVGLDNTVVPALSFFVALVVLWLVTLGWWPDWVGIGLIILVSALVSLVMRGLVMGIRDASTNAGIVAGSLGYFIIVATMLGASGYGAVNVVLPTGSIETPDDQNETAEDQGFVAATLECAGNIVTLGLLDMDCSQETTGSTFKKITDFASTVFNFARTAFSFLFQLLTFSLPIPVFFNALIVLPPAAALATVGFRFITRSGS